MADAVNPFKLATKEPATKAEPPAAPAAPSLVADAKPGEAQPPAQDKPKAGLTAEAEARYKQRQAELFKREQAIKAQEGERKAAWAKEQQELEYYRREWAKAQQAVKDGNYDEYLKWGGLTFEQIAKNKIQGDKRPVDQIVKAEMDAFKKQWAAERDEMAANQRKQQEEDQRKSFVEQNQGQLRNMIKADPDKYEFCIDDPNAHRSAWEKIEKLYEKHMDPATGKFRDNTPANIVELFNPMKTADLFTMALDAVEYELEDKGFSKYRSSKKIQQRLEAEKKSSQEKLEKEAAAKAAESNTKTGFKRTQIQSPSPAGEPAAQRQRHRVLSRQERLREAARILAQHKAASAQ